jgi:hypothetical protein
MVLSIRPAFSSELSYQSARLLADKNEKALSSSQLQALTSAQGTVGGTAMGECLALRKTSGAFKFALVMQLDESGKVARTWLDGDSDVAKCFEKKMATQNLFVPPFSPFYTVYDMTFR